MMSTRQGDLVGWVYSRVHGTDTGDEARNRPHENDTEKEDDADEVVSHRWVHQGEKHLGTIGRESSRGGGGRLGEAREALLG